MATPRSAGKRIVKSFDFKEGDVLVEKYEVLSCLGRGWEGEVYRIREMTTGIERAAKLFYPHRNVKNRTVNTYAKKLHRLRHCPVVIGYHTQETLYFEEHEIAFLISEYVEGEILSNFLKRQPGKKLGPFSALHFLYALAKGMERIHQIREYHGDIHSDNIIVQRFGLSFDLKVLDMFNWNAPRRENIQDDVCNMIHVFYESIGGAKHYSKQPQEIKNICCGLKRSLILKKFKSSSQLRAHLETMNWG